MSDETNQSDRTAEQWAAFQKIWTETFGKLTQAGFPTAETAPPEFLRQMRSGIFQALSQSWDEFLRSPQFLESMKQWMDNAVAFRRMTTDFLTRARHETQGTAKEDVDSILLALQHTEKRMLGRLEELSARVDALQSRAEAAATPPPAPPSKAVPKRRPARPAPLARKRKP